MCSEIVAGNLVEIKHIPKPGKPRKVVYIKRPDGRYLCKLINIPESGLTTGDETIIKIRRCEAEPDGPFVHYKARRYWIHDRGWLAIADPSTPARSRVKIPIELPVWEPVETVTLVGPGIYPLAAWPDARRWLRRYAEAGWTYLRIVLPSRSWLPGRPRSIWGRVDGVYQLDQPDIAELELLRAWLFYALQLGIYVQVDIWDNHILRGDWDGCWSNSEFNGRNNSAEYPLPADYERPDRWENAVEHALKGEETSSRARAYADGVWSTWGLLADYIPYGHIVGDGNEINSRTLSRMILALFPRHARAYGGQPLRNDEGVAYVAADSDLRNWVGYICLHHAALDEVQMHRSRLWPLMQAWGGSARVIGDTDGLRGDSGGYRGPGGRPTYEECHQIHRTYAGAFGQFYAGTGYKLLGQSEEVMRRDLRGFADYAERNLVC